MSAPKLFPKGDDRTWTRSFYHNINRIMRRLWYEQRCGEKVDKAVRETLLYGRTYTDFRRGPRSNWGAQ